MITSGCATFEPWASALGGIVGGLIVLPSSLFVLHVLKVDDPVDAVTVRTLSSYSAYVLSFASSSSSSYATLIVLPASLCLFVCLYACLSVCLSLACGRDFVVMYLMGWLGGELGDVPVVSQVVASEPLTCAHLYLLQVESRANILARL